MSTRLRLIDTLLAEASLGFDAGFLIIRRSWLPLDTSQSHVSTPAVNLKAEDVERVYGESMGSLGLRRASSLCCPIVVFAEAR